MASQDIGNFLETNWLFLVMKNDPKRSWTIQTILQKRSNKRFKRSKRSWKRSQTIRTIQTILNPDRLGSFWIVLSLFGSFVRSSKRSWKRSWDRLLDLKTILTTISGSFVNQRYIFRSRCTHRNQLAQKFRRMMPYHTFVVESEKLVFCTIPKVGSIQRLPIM